MSKRTAKPKRSATIYCSFCFALRQDITAIFHGASGVSICWGCMSHGYNSLAERHSDEYFLLSEEGLLRMTEDMSELLPAIDESVRGQRNPLQCAVGILRDEGVSWAQIGTALGISRQSAWERFR